MTTSRLTGIAAVLILIIIFYPVFSSNFAYLDEAHQLWYNDTDANLRLFLEQGRLLSGLLIQKLFGSISTINEIKWLRVFSFAGWGITVLIWNAVVSYWQRILGLDKYLAIFLMLFLPCSTTVAMAIGWASCAELYLAFIAGLLSGHLLFKSVYGHKEVHISSLRIILIISLGIISLFLYQPMFGAFLLPFFVYYINSVSKKPDRNLIIGISFYLVISLIYYLLFKYSLKQYGFTASDRTGLVFEPLRKLSFFISRPLAQAFSFNFLYNFHGVFSQVFFPLMFVAWVCIVFFKDKQNTFIQKLQYIIMVLLIMVLMCASILLTRDYFAPCRVVLCMDLAGAVLLMHAFFKLITTAKVRQGFTYFACSIILLTGWYNFNINYIRPLKKEYSSLSAYFQENYTAETKKVYFIRPQEALFKKLYGINVYNDEFGVPSTYKDWTPEPLVRQLALELTGNKQKAKRLEIVNLPYEHRDSITNVTLNAATLLIDTERILK